VLGLATACTGGQTSIGGHDFGLANEVGGGGSGFGTPPCAWSGTDGLVAEWHANTTLGNQVPCSAFHAEVSGHVPYGPGRLGQAWQFRSTWTSVEGGDPNFVNLARTQAVTLPQVSVDAWVQQTHFNDYNNSNRMIFSTSYRPQPDMLPGESQLYLHENKAYYAFVKVGSGAVLNEDYAGCHFASLGEPGVQAPLNQWFRLSYTYDGLAIRCFVNGVLQTETEAARETTADGGPGSPCRSQLSGGMWTQCGSSTEPCPKKSSKFPGREANEGPNVGRTQP